MRALRSVDIGALLGVFSIQRGKSRPLSFWAEIKYGVAAIMPNGRQTEEPCTSISVRTVRTSDDVTFERHCFEGNPDGLQHVKVIM